MAIVLSKLLSIGGATTVAGSVAGGGYVAYKNRDVIIKTFSIESNSNKPKLTKKTQATVEPETNTEDIPDTDIEQVADQKPENTKPIVADPQVSLPVKVEPQAKNVAQVSQVSQVAEVSKVEKSQELQQVEQQQPVEEETQEDVLEAPPVEETDAQGSGSSVLDSGEPLYIIAKFTEANTKDTSKQLHTTSTNEKNYLCQYDKTTKQSYDNTTCKIFKLSANTSKTESIEFPQDETTNEVKNTSDLTNGNNYLLRISSKFHQQFTKENQKIKLLDKGQPQYSFGDFSDFIEIDKGPQKLNKENIKSNLFTVFVTDVDTSFTGDVDYDTDAYKCQLFGQSPVNCKFYKLGNSASPYSKTDLDGVSKITAIQTNLTKDKYILVEVEGESQSTPQLKGKFQIYKSANTNVAIVTGVAEELVIGKLGVLDTTSASNLFIPKDTFGVLTDAGATSTDNAYIITKAILVNEYLKKAASYTSTDYTCRVIAGDKKHDDESCKLFQYPATATKDYFDFEIYKTGNGDITNFSELTAEKQHQVIVLKKHLQDALKTTDATLHLIRTDRKDKVLNNQVIQFEKVHDFTDDVSSESDLKTNLFLVRYKAPKAAGPAASTKTAKPKATVTNINPDIDVTCKIGDEATETNCKIYKFATSQKSNTLAKDAISKLKDQTNTSFANDFHYVIELAGPKKAASDLQNKIITVKQGALAIGNFEFDSLIFGKAKIGGMQLKREEVGYLVERTGNTPWKTTGSGESYRCKLPAPTPAEATSLKTDNFDFDCKLVEIKRDTNNFITSYSSIKNTETKKIASELTSSNDQYFKLIFDKKLLYNFTPSSTTSINIEIVAGKNKYVKAVNVLGKISASDASPPTTDTFKTSTNLGLFELKKAATKDTSTSPSTTQEKPQCSFSSDNTNKFDCTIYKVTPSPVTSPVNISSLLPSTSEEQSDSEFSKEKDLFVIDFKTKKELSELTTEKIIYYYSHKVVHAEEQDPPAQTQWETWTTEFTLKAPLLGSNASSKQLFFVEDPTFP